MKEKNKLPEESTWFNDRPAIIMCDMTVIDVCDKKEKEKRNCYKKNYFSKKCFDCKNKMICRDKVYDDLLKQFEEKEKQEIKSYSIHCGVGIFCYHIEHDKIKEKSGNESQ